MAKNEVDDDLMQFVTQTPDAVGYMASYKGRYTQNRAKLLAALKVLSNDKCIQMSEAEFVKRYGKCGLNVTRAYLREHLKGKNPKIVVHENKYFISCTN